MASHINADITILLVDESESRLDVLNSALQEAGYANIVAFHGTDGLLEHVRDVQPNVVLIDVNSPRRDTFEQLCSIRDRSPTPVVLFTQDPEAQSIQAAVTSGVCAYVVDGISKDRVKPAIEVAMATFQQYEALRSQLRSAKQELTDHRRIERAKAVLMNQRGMTEEEAHRCLRKLSMDRKRKLRDVADDLLSIAEVLGPK